MRKNVLSVLGWGAAASMAVMAVPASAQQTLPPPLAGEPASEVPVAIQILKWRMLDSDVSSLTFRSMDVLFPTRTVPRAGPVWELPRADRPLDFTYSHGGAQYDAEDFLERTYTNALIIMKDGRIVSEIYRNNTDAQTRFIGWSMTKSLTSVLVGSALEEGLIRSIDDPITAYLPELEGGGYDGVSIRHILEMRSGVDYEERYDFENPGAAARNHIDALVKNVARFADPARTIARVHAPGTVFQYKTLDTAVLGWLIERVSGQTVSAYTARKLWEPLGAESDGFYIMDGQPGVGREFSGAGFNATARDFARFGQMVLNGGVANGRRVVSEEWIAQSTRSAFEEDPKGGGYGYQWWTTGGSEAFAAIGLQGQFVYVDPATRTVMVKLSYFPPDDRTSADETAAFFRAASAWSPGQP